MLSWEQLARGAGPRVLSGHVCDGSRSRSDSDGTRLPCPAGRPILPLRVRACGWRRPGHLRLAQVDCRLADSHSRDDLLHWQAPSPDAKPGVQYR